ncbi:hypothetical protein L249_4895 [Ophiocordyceps polyrhachis-furcata BCC 54312]|uniref:Uncharacterized protein n=1 Tax=Ophiocordyceps polyrhachis-furcata BCC 54312 TaxID=1330021 RepID=A0A367L2W6_9HYPO|nr:hypothetical protein L249_4895 [Ophiocordyceps polyrhachis-furcata BCC 54312]
MAGQVCHYALPHWAEGEKDEEKQTRTESSLVSLDDPSKASTWLVEVDDDNPYLWKKLQYVQSEGWSTAEMRAMVHVSWGASNVTQGRESEQVRVGTKDGGQDISDELLQSGYKHVDRHAPHSRTCVSSVDTQRQPIKPGELQSQFIMRKSEATKILFPSNTMQENPPALHVQMTANIRQVQQIDE